MAALICGLSSFAIQFSASRPVVLDNSVADFSRVSGEFILLDTPAKFVRSNGYFAGIKLISAELAGEHKALAAVGKLRGDESLKSLVSGATYRCTLALSPTSLGERAGFKSRCTNLPKIVGEVPATNSLIASMRSKFMQNLRGVDKDSAGLVAGLAIGDTSGISTKLQQDMKVVSLTHLTAVSGANCAIVLAMFYLVIRKLGGGRWVRLTGGLIALVGYVLLVGAQPSVLRAAVMAAAVLVGISIGRKTAPMSALAIAVIILLVADPWLAVDFGFALSVAATAGLLVLTQPITQKLKRYFPSWLAIALGVSIAAQIFCLPILLQLQTGLATFSLPANILAEPLVAPVTVLGIVACLTAWFFPPIAWCCTFLASEATLVIARIAHGFANQSHSVLSWPTGIPGALAAGCVILGFVLWLRAEPTKLRNLGLMGLSLVTAISVGSIGFSLVRSAQWPLSDWSVVSCDVGQGDATVVRSQGQIALIDVGREDRPVDECLRQLNVKRIDLLVLTHFDMDHIGGLHGAIDGRQVGLAMVSPFKDQRWGATGTNRYLADTGVTTIAAEKGMTGTLGEFAWRVLAPNRGAVGSVDSNDASVVMLWCTNAFNLLTMADLGEKGQLRIAADLQSWSGSANSELPLILKVSHHGSADQSERLIADLDPDLSLISVGKANTYGHPTQRTLSMLGKSGSAIYRTDELGAISLASRPDGLVISNAPRG